MFFAADDEDGGGGMFQGGLAKLNQRESEKTARALALLEKQMYASDADSTAAEEEVPEVGDEYRRFESMGYSAHTDSVEPHEIRQWRRAFPYLRIEGKGFDLGVPVDDNSGIQSVPMPVTSEPFANLQAMQVEPEPQSSDDGPLQQLMISGVGLALHPCVQQSLITTDGKGDSDTGTDVDDAYADSEETFAAHGCLEEVLAIDACTLDLLSVEEADSAVISGEPVSPHLARRAEVVAILADAIWPDLVAELRPLVQRIVRESRAAGLLYPPESFEEQNDGSGSHENIGAGEVLTFRSDNLDDSGW